MSFPRDVASRPGDAGPRALARSSIRDMFDRIAPSYDALNRTLSLGIDQRWRRRAIACLGRLENRHVLDLCAGTLDVASLITLKFPSARLFAVDFSRAMLTKGRGARGDGQARLFSCQADALRLPTHDAVFSAAICAFGVRNLDDPERGLREVARVLAPGGRFAVLEFFRPETRRQKIFHGLYNRTVLPGVGTWISGDQDAYRYLAASMERFLSVDEFASLAVRCGFAVASTSALFPGVATLIVLDKRERDKSVSDAS